MKVLLLGATGLIGSVVADRLIERGHHVTGLVRPGRSAEDLPTGVELRHGDLTDPASLTAAVTADIDAVVNLATPTGDASIDLAATEALVAPLRSTGRAYLYTSGVWVLGRTGDTVADEDTPTDPIPLVGYRPQVEHATLSAADDGVRAVVVRPGVVHGRGAGIPAMLLDWARADGTGRYVGDPSVRWPMIHIDDLADLYVAALTRAGSGAILHAVAESGVPARDLARAAAIGAGVRPGAEPWSVAEAGAELGAAFAEALGLDQVVSSRRTRELLGWSPQQADAVTDLGSGSYARAATGAA